MTKRVFLRKILLADSFFLRLASNLDKIFQNGWAFPDEYDCDIFCDVGGTVGWGNALSITLRAYGLEDCLDYYEHLDWYESDELDAEVIDLMLAVAFDEDKQRVRFVEEFFQDNL